MSMAAKRLDPAEGLGDEPSDATLIQFNIRVPRGLLRELDAWLAQDNAARRFTKRNRSDLIRDTLFWAVEHKPDLGGK